MKKKLHISEGKKHIQFTLYDTFMDGDFEIPTNISETEYFANKDLAEKHIEGLIEKHNLKLIFETVQLGTKFQTYESRD